MKSPVVLAYAGGIHATAAIPWLADTLGIEVVTVTLDVGQGHELAELRARALACGAVRAHAVDARDGFARDVLVPSLFTREPAEAPSISRLPWPLIARTLTEIARIEGAGAVAHGSTDLAFDAGIHAVDASVSIIAPAREWTMNDADLIEYARARRLPLLGPTPPGCRIDQNMWGRSIAWEGDEEPSAVRAPRARGRVHEPALVDIHFERGMPTAVNGVPMSPAELIDCLSLIGSQHGVGRRHVALPGGRHVLHDAPAATILRVAAAEVGGSGSADVCLRLADGQYTVLNPADRHALLVNYA
jgi:argininosuccinate synthase